MENAVKDDIIAVTEKALKKIHSIFMQEKKEENVGLRVGVIGGGCSGLSYKIDFDRKKEKDHVLSLGRIKVFIDLKSAIYLKGVTLDFNDGLDGKGFIFVNPNATNTCGCGESFSL